MACITVSVDKSFKERLGAFPWVNWSEVSREEAMKKEIFERFLKTRKLSEEDEQFCESIDWHPVDELPMREEQRDLYATLVKALLIYRPEQMFLGNHQRGIH